MADQPWKGVRRPFFPLINLKNRWFAICSTAPIEGGTSSLRIEKKNNSTAKFILTKVIFLNKILKFSLI